MIEKFLNAKHWQLFTIMFGIPMIYQFWIMGNMFSTINPDAGPAPESMFNTLKLFPIIMIIYMGLLFGWFWSIAMGLQEKVPENVKMKTKKFKVFFFIPLVYITLLSLFLGNMFSVMSQIDSEPSGGMVGAMAGIIFPLHILSMVGIFYSMYFVAKTFKTVELQREVKFGDFAGEFFMFWFYPIGIWILQPKINKMIEV